MRRAPFTRLSLWATVGGFMLVAVTAQPVHPQDGAVPRDRARGHVRPQSPFLQYTAPGSLPIKYYLGVTVSPASETLRAQLGLPEGQGLVVDHVVPGSPAAKARMARHDVLLSAGGSSLARPEDLTKAVERAGDERAALQLELRRRSETHTIRVEPVDVLDGFVTWSGVSDQVLGPASAPAADVIVLGPLAAVVSQPREFPSDLEVVISKRGAAPAKFVVTRGASTWTATEKTLDELPGDVREHVQYFIHQLGRVKALRSFANPASRPAAPLDKRFDQIDERLRAIEKMLNEKPPGQTGPDAHGTPGAGRTNQGGGKTQ